MVRILVTGGTGLVGQALVPRLRVWAEGVDVLSRTEAGDIKGDLRQWDGGIPAARLKSLRGRYDAMVHLAARYDLRAARADAYQHTVIGTQTALTLAAKLDIPHFVHLSTVAVALGDDGMPGSFSTDRLSVDRPFPDSYAYAKAQAEAMVRQWLSGVPDRTICRLGIVVGDTEGNPPLRLDGPYRAVSGLSGIRHLLWATPGPLPLVGHEQARLPLVPVDVAARALDRLIQMRSAPGISCFHLTPEHGVALSEFYRFVLDRLGLKGRRFSFMSNLPRGLQKRLVDLAVGIPAQELEYTLRLPRFDSSATRALLGEGWCPEFAEYQDAFWKGYMSYVEDRGAELQRPTQNAIRPRRADPEFAFIIHPLSNRQVFQIPGLGPLRRLPVPARDWVERQVAKVPGFLYGHLDNVVSKSTGREVSGLIYCLPATPRTLLEGDVQTVYAQINAICEHAAGAGAKIVGLGAYTKIVGDAGVSINQSSPVPVTTGNSLSASATLWAVYEVTRKLGLVKVSPGGRQFDGVAMVIGATGSIGRVSAKLLALAFRRLVLVAPRVEGLQEIAREIGEIAPHCDLAVSTSADDWAATADVIVTATSSRGRKVVDVGRLKPGAIVCDCSRPLDFTLEEAMSRPDVLIIESGEVLLPGPAKLDCYIGLPDRAVWACLGETALLALAQRYEAFSLGRDLDWRRVKEIYRLAREHGVGLAAIRGHAGAITDREIALTRELALKRGSAPWVPTLKG